VDLPARDAPGVSVACLYGQEQVSCRNVEIARILGWKELHHTGDRPEDLYGTAPDVDADNANRFYEHVPDFSKDSAFILRMMEANRLAVDSDSPHSPLDWVAYAPCNDDLGSIIGRGTSVSDAVLNWICAADKAGVRIER